MSGVNFNSTSSKPYSPSNPPPAGTADQLDANGTVLDIGAVADGEYLRRSGTDVVGDILEGGGSVKFHGVLTDAGDFATLDASSISAGTAVDTLGYASAGDGDAGRYEIRATSDTPDNVFIFDTATSGKQAHFIGRLSNKGFLFHDDDPNAERSRYYNSVEWMGSVEPVNALDNDTWINTSI